MNCEPITQPRADPGAGVTDMIRHNAVLVLRSVQAWVLCSNSLQVSKTEWCYIDRSRALFQNHVLICMQIITREVCSDRTPFSFLTSVVLSTLHITSVLHTCHAGFFNTCLDFSPAELCSTTHLPPQRANYKPLF